MVYQECQTFGLWIQPTELGHPAQRLDEGPSLAGSQPPGQEIWCCKPSSTAGRSPASWKPTWCCEEEALVLLDLQCCGSHWLGCQALGRQQHWTPQATLRDKVTLWVDPLVTGWYLGLWVSSWQVLDGPEQVLHAMHLSWGWGGGGRDVCGHKSRTIQPAAPCICGLWCQMSLTPLY